MKKYQIPEDQRNLVAAVRSAAIVLLVGFLGYLADPVAILNAFFPIMVLAIALGGSVPKLQHFWHKNYPVILLSLAFVCAVACIHAGYSGYTYSAMYGYVGFLLSVLPALALGKIMYFKGGEAGYASPKQNLTMLVIGMLMGNIVGTAAVVAMLGPTWIRANRSHWKNHHFAFFMLLVLNMGPAFVPTGPPLLAALLKGISPDFWFINGYYALITMVCLVVVFYLVDAHSFDKPKKQKLGLSFSGAKYWPALVMFLFTTLTIGRGLPFDSSITPTLNKWLSSVTSSKFVLDSSIDLIRWAIQIIVLAYVLKVAWKVSTEARKSFGSYSWSFFSVSNKELVVVFLALFIALPPIEHAAAHFVEAHPLGTTTKAFAIMGFSSVADNFIALLLGMSSEMAQQGWTDPASLETLGRTSLILMGMFAMYGGALTYIGNAPNLSFLEYYREIRQANPNMPEEMSFFGLTARMMPWAVLASLICLGLTYIL